jgi:prevent-host-death family protein
MRQSSPAIISQIAFHQAKARLSEVLDRVERGEEIVITRHGRPVARIVGTGPGHDVAAARAAAADLLAMRDQLAAEGVRPLTMDELLALRDEGRKY